MDRDKLKEKIAKAICQKGGRRVTDERWNEWLETWRRATDEARKHLHTNDCLLNAEAALTVIEEAGYADASAVWDKAVEACAKELENRAENHAQIAKDHDGWQQEILMAKGQSLAEIVGCIHSLKRSDKTEKPNG